MGPLELFLQMRPLSVDGVVLDENAQKDPTKLFEEKNRVHGTLWLNQQEGTIEFQTNSRRDLTNKEIYCSQTSEYTDLSIVVAQHSVGSSYSLHYVTYASRNSEVIKLMGWNGMAATFTYPSEVLKKIFAPVVAELDGIKIGKGLLIDIGVGESEVICRVYNEKPIPIGVVSPISLCQLARHLNTVMTALCKIPICYAPIHVGQLRLEEDLADTFFAIGRLEDGMRLTDAELVAPAVFGLSAKEFREMFENLLGKNLTPAYLWREYTIVQGSPVRTMEVLLYFLFVAIDKISVVTPETKTQRKEKEICQKFLQEASGLECLEHGEGRRLKKFLDDNLARIYSDSAFEVKIKHVFNSISFREDQDKVFAKKSQTIRDTLMHDGAIVQLLEDMDAAGYYSWLVQNTHEAVIRYLTGGYSEAK